MSLNQEISNNAFSAQYQNKIFFYFVLVFASLLVLLKLPMASLYYDTVSSLITFAPMIVILAMAGISFWKGKLYPDYQPIIRKFYLIFTLKFLIAILFFYIFYSPGLFLSPLIAFWNYLKTLLTFEGFYFLSSYLLTGVIALSTIFVAFRAYQKTKGSWDGSIQILTKRTLYAVFALSFLIFASSAAAYPNSYKPLTDTLGDSIYTLSRGTLKFFKGGNADDYAKIDSLKKFTDVLSKSIKKTSINLTQNNQEFKTNLTLASTELKTSITKSSQDLSDKIKEDLTGKLDSVGGTLEGSLLIKGDDADLTVEGLTTTRDIIPDDTLSYNLGKSGKSWNELYIHRLIGSSPVFIGKGNSNQGLTADGDLVISNDLEIQGRLYAANYAFPNTDGNVNQLLQTDGNGNLTWGDGITLAGTNGQLQFNNNGALGATANLAWNTGESRLEVGGTVEATAFMLPGGIYLNADSVSTNYWAENGGDIYRETGNFGFGNNSPQERLDVSGRIYLSQLAAPGTTTNRLYNVAGDLFWNGLKMGENFWAQSSDNVSYTLSGNVGIGTTSPLSKLSVVGTVRATNFFDETSSAYLTPGSINGNYWGESAGNIYRETGNVAIGGTDASGYKFYVNGNMYGSGTLTLDGNLILGGNTLTTTNAIVIANLNSDLLDGNHETAFALLSGRAGGQTLIGGTASGNNLTLQSTSHATKGKILFGTSAYDEVNQRLGIGTVSPASPLQVVGTNGLFLLSDNVTASTQKLGRIGVPHYTEGEEPVGVIYGNAASASTNVVNFGGGTSVFNAATKLSFWTAALATTVTGTERMTILGDGNVGFGIAAPTSRIHGVTTLSAATGDEIAYQLNYTTNKLTSGNDTGLLINQTDTASPGTSMLADFQVGGNSRFSVSGGGVVTVGGYIANNAFATKSASTAITFWNGQTMSTPTGSSAITILPGITNSSGTSYGLSITPTWNQTSTAAGTDLLINRTETAVGSGAQLLIDAQVGGVSKFKVDNGGNITVGGFITNGDIVHTYNDVYGLDIYSTGNVALASSFATTFARGSTFTQTSGSGGALKIAPTYNQASGTAANTDLLINRTETAVGSGTQRLIDAQVGGVSKFSVSNTGNATAVNISIGGSLFNSGNNPVSVSAASGSATTALSSFEVIGTNSRASLAVQYARILPVYTQSGTAAATDLFINRTETSLGSGAQLLIDAQVGGVTKFKASNIGWVYGYGFSSLASTATLYLQGKVGANTGDAITMSSSTFSASSGIQNSVSILPTYNQSGTAAATDLLINRTQTAVGSGAQLLIDAQVGGVSKFKVSNAGQGYFAGNVGIGTTAPGNTLNVVGSICAKADSSACAGTTAGSIYADSFIAGGTALNVPDYVFESNYNLMPLDQLATFITQHKHLPGVPSADDVEKAGGLNLGQMVPAILEKTEENTLYILGLNLKTDSNITTIGELKTSVDANLDLISNKFTNLNDKIDKDIKTLTDRQDSNDSLISILQGQMAELKVLNDINLSTILQNTSDIKSLSDQVASILSDDPNSLNSRLNNLETLSLFSSRNLENGGLEITIVDLDAPTIGTATIMPADADNDGKSVIVKTKAVTKNSKIFVSFNDDLEGKSWFVEKRTAGESFTIKLSAIATEELDFDWWIVEEKK